MSYGPLWDLYNDLSKAVEKEITPLWDEEKERYRCERIAAALHKGESRGERFEEWEIWAEDKPTDIEGVATIPAYPADSGDLAAAIMDKLIPDWRKQVLHGSHWDRYSN
jgi:hypothetical protein